MITVERYHDFSAGHRVAGHETKCRHLHGHNYRVTFFVTAPDLDSIGRIIDFGAIKDRLCMWLEDNWDHKTLIWKDDNLLASLSELIPEDIVITDFNPTAENMAKNLVTVVAPKQLEGTECKLIACKVEETRKCSATFSLD